LILPIWIIKNAKNVIIWGRNPYVTNIHLLHLIKDKFAVTIDAIKTKTAKKYYWPLTIIPLFKFSGLYISVIFIYLQAGGIDKAVNRTLIFFLYTFIKFISLS
jgi:hypothetical protein